MSLTVDLPSEEVAQLKDKDCELSWAVIRAKSLLTFVRRFRFTVQV